MPPVAFFNPAHNGDIHVSRQLVRYVVEHVPAERFFYWHRNSPRLLLDLPNVTVGVPPAAITDRLAYQPMFVCNGVTVLNTWYRVSPAWDAGGSCTLATLYALFQANIARLGAAMTGPIESFVPRINFAVFHTGGVRRYMEQVACRFRRKVLVANALPLSGQSRAHPVTLVDALRPMIAVRPDTLFLFTNRENAKGIAGPNVAYTRDVIGLAGDDLNETAFVSTFCDVIIGLASGAYTFAYIADNLFDARKTFICFSNNALIARWVPAEKLRAKVVASGSATVGEMQHAVAGVLGAP